MGWFGFGGYTKEDISKMEAIADMDGLLKAAEELYQDYVNDITKGGVLVATIEALGRIGKLSKESTTFLSGRSSVFEFLN